MQNTMTSAEMDQNRGLSEKTQKRKMQNRIAQKKYRRRMKASAESADGPRVTAKGTQNATPSSQCQVLSQPIQDERNETIDIDLMNHGDLGSDFMFNDFPDFNLATSEDLSCFQIDTLDGSNVPFFSDHQTIPPIDSTLGMLDADMSFDAYFDQLSSVDLSFGGMGSTLSPSPNTSYQHNDPCSFKISPPPRSKQLKAYPTPPHSTTSSTDINNITSKIISHLQFDDSNENKSIIKTTLARGHNIRDVLLAGLAALGKTSPPKSQPPIPHPHKTSITLKRTSTVQAYMAIWTSMSFEIPPNGHEDWQTPFYKPEPQSLAPNRQYAVIVSHDSLPICMRPTPAQKSFPHLAWIDVIPFPILRERLVSQMAMASNPLIDTDLDELKDDLFMRNGMFCWRSGESGNGGSGQGQPWDMRSWEAEMWFLVKWKVLLGGEGGEVWRQTMWWRAMRGKDL